MIKNAKWIMSPVNEDDASYTFYTDFNTNKTVLKAVLKASAMGLYIAFVNGERVGNELLTPYWTEHKLHTQYQTYDVTHMLGKKNELSFACAEGWAVGFIRTGAEYRKHYHDNISLIFSLEVTYEDGSVDTITSDECVKVRTSQILSSSIYDGEVVDRTASAKELGCAKVDAAVKTKLVEQFGEKVTEQEFVYPVKMIVTPRGEKVIDFGQNLAGYIEVTARGDRGSRIVLSHGEVLDSEGNFYTDNLRMAKQRNTYVLSGKGEEIFKPSFTWQGFRYARIDEYPCDNIDLSDFKAIVIHSDIKRTGCFECGNAKVNQLYRNVIWGQKSNFIDVPTDCPQRDERLGWTGDAQVFVRTAAINYNVERFFSKWLKDLAAGQFDDGGVGWEVPSSNLNYPENVSSGWGDAAVICPWEIYLAYGNKEILENQFESMKKWIDYMHAFGDEEFLWIGGKQFGDWLATDNPNDPVDPRRGLTSTDFISSAFFAYSTSLFIKAGCILGRDMTEYEMLYGNIVDSFAERFLKDGVPIQKTQTACVLALRFDLAADKKGTTELLCELIEKNGHKLNTGFLGTPHILHALSENGHVDTAYDLLLNEENPSWLYQVNNGATTIWEHWDSIKDDGSFWDTSMNSFNHYAYGSVYDWIFGVSAGIKPLEDGAGYKHVLIKPNPDKRLGFVDAGIETRYGRLSGRWAYTSESVKYEINIPRGVTAEIELPDGKSYTLTGGKYNFATET